MFCFMFVIHSIGGSSWASSNLLIASSDVVVSLHIEPLIAVRDRISPGRFSARMPFVTVNLKGRSVENRKATE